MRGLRSFLALLILGVGLGAYLYFVESKKTPGDSAEKKDKVFTVESDKVEQFTLTNDKGEQTTVKRAAPGKWEMTQPAGIEADEGAANAIALNLHTLEVQRVVDENPSDLKEFGLDTPHVAVAFKADGKDHRLQIGNKTPTQSDLYARVDDQKRVILIPSTMDAVFNRSTFDLRNKAVVKIDRGQVDSLEVVTPDHQMTVVKKGEEWQMTSPINTRADFTGIESLVSKISDMEMKSLAAAEGGDPKTYGLDKPAATVRLGTGSSKATILIGGSAPDEAVYARDESRPAVFTIDASILEDIKKDPAEYRQKDLFDARTFNTTRLQIVRNGQTTVFEKSGNKWKQTSPSAKDVDATKVDSVLSILTGGRANSFVEKAPAGAKTEMVVTIKFDEGKKEETVTLMKAGADAFATRSGSPGIAKIDPATIDNTTKALEDIK
jgi:hypothetical protein